MSLTEQDVKVIMRRTLDEVARQLGIGDPEIMEENTELLPAIMFKNQMAYQVLGSFRTAYRLWFAKSQELERASSQGLDLTKIQIELMGLMKARDMTREAMIRYLDHHNPHSNSRVTV